MTQATIAINDIYEKYLDCTSRVQIYFGGSASGKSVFLAQRAILDLLEGKRNYLVCRQVSRTIRGSVATELQKVIIQNGFTSYFNVNKTDGTITCKNGKQIIFAGLDDVEKLKSITPVNGSITDLWIEEATETTKNSIKQLIKRQRGGDSKTPKRVTLSFNPVLKSHWIYQEYFNEIGWAEEQQEYQSPGLSILKTTYKDNRYLTPDDVKDLENETDSYYYQVYSLGNWGVLGGVIFTNWRVEDLSELQNQFTNRRNGLDFGFSSDPAAMVVTHYDRMRKTIYIYKEVYERGLTNDVLGSRVKDYIGFWESKDTGEVDEDGDPIYTQVCMGTERVVCDSSEPKSIQELSNSGIHAVGALKGKDSISFGIDWLKQQTIVVDKSCINIQNELSQYHWKKDAGGNSLKIPVDKNNHLIDALRYAYEDDMDRYDSTKLVSWA